MTLHVPHAVPRQFGIGHNCYPNEVRESQRHGHIEAALVRTEYPGSQNPRADHDR